MPKIYIIAGCNGSGKTTISKKLLPDILKCKEYVNADEIAKGLSPFQSETLALKAERFEAARLHNNINLTFSFYTKACY